MKTFYKNIIRIGSGMLVCSLLSYQSFAKGPSDDYLRAAETYYNNGDYFSAASYYEKYLSVDSTGKKTQWSPYVVQKVAKKALANPASRKEIVYKLAESYRLLHYYSKAEPFYKEAVDMGIHPLAGYWYGKTLKADDKGGMAETAFNDFLKSYTTQDEFSRDAAMELENLKFAAAELKKKDLYKYKVDKMDAAVNTPGANYASFILGDGSVVFTSTRSDSSVSGKGNPHTNKLMKATPSAKAFANLQKLDLAPEKDMEQGVAAFTPDGSKMFVTRWIAVDGKKTSAIYSADKSTTGWSVPAKLSDAINAAGSNAQQPFVTADGKTLIFSSDRAGGSGKFDLWMIPLDAAFAPNGTASNLGASINSAGDDEAPFYHQASKTLVFATNGRKGMGGLDLFYAKGDLASTWEAPQNMGYPVNSIKDDIYYTSADKKSIWNNAYLSSDRNSPCCLELYVFDKTKTLKTVSGTVVDCDSKAPVPGATINVTSADGIVMNKTTDANGRYEMTMEDFTALKIDASSPGYSSNTINVDVPADMEKELLSNPAICLSKPVKVDTIAVDVPMVLDNVLYDFNKATLKSASFPALDKLVELMNSKPGMAVELGSHTDDVGADKYNMTLSEKRAAACVAYLVSKGIDASRLESKGYGETKPVAPNRVNGKDNPKGRAENRRTEFKVLHY